MNVGNKLKGYRLFFNLSQEELAYKAGLNEKYYGRLERNESCPTIEKLQQICTALNIDIVSFFLYDISKNNCFFNQEIITIIIEGLKYNIDIHFNKENLITGCNSCIWYNGFIGSASFNEFEFQLFAIGNIRGKLYKNFIEVLNLNDVDVSSELLKYVKNDIELNNLIEFMAYDEEVLREKGGNALFIQESNWLTIKLIDNQNEIIINEGIILDEDNILNAFGNKEALISYIFNR